jgi:lipopolysaccharide transport system permease protein
MIIDKNLINFTNQISIALKRLNLLNFFFKNTVLLLTRRTLLSSLWLFLKPAVPLLVYTIVFGTFINIKSEISYPYLIFLLSGFVPWAIFDDCLYWTTRTYEANKKIIKKINIPFLLLPIGSSLAGLLMSLTSLIFLIFATIYYSVTDMLILSINLKNILLILVSIISSYFFALGLGYILCIFNARFRDTKFSVKIFLSGLLYITPVMYPLSKIPEKFTNFILIFNPISIPVLNFRCSFVNSVCDASLAITFLNLILSIFILLIGIKFYLNSVKQGIIIK